MGYKREEIFSGGYANVMWITLGKIMRRGCASFHMKKFMKSYELTQSKSHEGLARIEYVYICMGGHLPKNAIFDFFLQHKFLYKNFFWGKIILYMCVATIIYNIVNMKFLKN